MLLKAEFGKEVQKKRLQANISQYALSRMVDVSLRHIYNIEHGKTEPQLSTVYRLAVCLDIDLNVFKAYVKSDDGIYWKDGATLTDGL